MADDQELLSDEGMREFIRKGFVTFDADMPTGFHETVFQRTEHVMETAGNPGNNVMAVIPELQEVLDHPKVAGTLSSVLGPGYELNANRYCHRRPVDAEAQSPLHQDGRTEGHRMRRCQIFYYPQETNVELGPTNVFPGSQYYNHEPDAEVGEETPFCGAAGSVTVVHYDLWHRRSEKIGEGHRFMYKFLFTRMEEPTAPAWDCNDLSWLDADDRRNSMWKTMWEWSAGGNGSSTQGAAGGDVAELVERLEDANETTSFQAAYSLAAMGGQAVPELITRLSSDNEDLRRNAGYSLAAIGRAAVPALEEAAGADRVETRAVAVDALGNMGRPAAAASGTLQTALKDENGDVRMYAARALGNVGDAAAAAVPSLIDALADAEDWVVRDSLLALAKLGPDAAEAAPRLDRYLRHESRYVRAKAALALQRIGTEEATDTLIKHLNTARWCPLTNKDSQY
jgi:hypothetical protein